MNRKLKGSVLSLVALSQLAGIAMQPVMTVYANETWTMTTDATERLNKVKDAVSKMEASPNKESIKHAMNSFVQLYSAKEEHADGDMALLENGHADEQFKKILNTLHKQDGGVQNELSLYFFNQMGLRFGNDQAYYFNDHLTDLVENTKDPAMNDRLMSGAGELNHIYFFKPEETKENSNGDLFHIVDGNIKLINPIDKTVDAETNASEVLPDLEIDHSLDSGESEADDSEAIPMDDTWEDVFYEIIDGKPMKIVVTYTRINGEVTSVERQFEVPFSEAFAGTEEDWKIINEGTAEVEGVADLVVEDEAIEEERSNNTLHYTVSKGTDDVYFYDTGIRVDKDGNASYQQVKDVLYQLAIRSEGYLAEDEGKFLIVVEGKPVLVREEKATYNKAEIEAMFKSFKSVEMRIMPTRIGTTASLEEQLVSGKEQTVKVNGKDANLKHHPMIEDGQVLLSIEELAALLQLKYESDKTKHTVSKDDHRIVYEENVKAVTVDGKVKELSTPSVLNKEGALMGDITELLNLFGVDMIWDEEDSAILLETK